jgi:hypothetical protein
LHRVTQRWLSVSGSVEFENEGARKEKTVKDLERITNPNTITWRIKEIRHDGGFQEFVMLPQIARIDETLMTQIIMIDADQGIINPCTMK